MKTADEDALQIIKDRDCTRDTPLRFGGPDEAVYGKGIALRPRCPGKSSTAYEQRMNLSELLPLEDYDLIIVLYSAGKDSTAVYYKLRELGVPKSKIELWHHDVDGQNPDRRMDWPVTQAYVRAFAQAEGVPLRLSWRIGGFFGEVYRLGASMPIQYEDNGKILTCRLTPAQLESDRLRELILAQEFPEEIEALKKYGCRMKFPAKTGNLALRWCSASLKIDVASAVVRNLAELGSVRRLPAKGSISRSRYCTPNLKRRVGDAVLRDLYPHGQMSGQLQPPMPDDCTGAMMAEVGAAVDAQMEQTEGVRILITSGERRGESANRAHYNEMEIHRCNATVRGKRLVHAWRPVIDYTEKDVWEVIKRHRVTPHPCYTCGWNRCSCMMCIFSRPSLWAGIRELFPADYEAFRQDEKRLGYTLDTKVDLDTFVGDAPSCVHHGDPKALHQLVSGEFSVEDIYTKEPWAYPAGAFHGAEGGPC